MTWTFRTKITGISRVRFQYEKITKENIMPWEIIHGIEIPMHGYEMFAPDIFMDENYMYENVIFHASNSFLSMKRLSMLEMISHT